MPFLNSYSVLTNSLLDVHRPFLVLTSIGSSSQAYMICHWGKLRLILSFSTVKENVETITYTQKSALDQFVNPSALVSEHTVLKVCGCV